MRGHKMNGYIGEIRSSFLSCEKDTESIVRKLFVESNPYSDDLKRLLILNTKDCLRDKTNPKYLEKINKISVADLNELGYIRTRPQIKMGENEDVKSYIIISYDNFIPNENNNYYRDCIVMIDILCHIDTWELGNYQLRPIKIMGIIDGLLNGAKLSGIGTLDFIGANELVLNEEMSGYCLMFSATHGNDDNIVVLEEE